MITTRHAVNFAYTGPELAALFAYARAHDVEQGGRYDTRSAAIILWSHHWQHPATREESEILGTFYVRWDPFVLWQIETEEGFSLEDLMQALGHLELAALGYVKHGHVVGSNNPNATFPQCLRPRHRLLLVLNSAL